jgi:outer membrane protein TolC
MTPSRLAPLLSLALAAGCASYEPKPIEPARTEAEFRARGLSDPGLDAFLRRNGVARTAGAWDLERLTLAALYFHPDIEVARARVRVTGAAIITAGGRPNPILILPGDYAHPADIGTNPFTYGLNLDIPIETAGKRGKRIAQAERLDEAERLDLGDVAWKVRSRLRAALAEDILARADADTLREEERLRADLRAVLEVRLAAGEASAVEVHVARTDLATATLDARAAEGHVGESRASLAQAIGVPAATLAGVPVAWDDIDRLPTRLADVERVGLLNRLDIRRSFAEYAAAEAALELEVAKQYPDVHFFPGYLFEQGQNRFQYGFSVELPILNQNQGPIAEAAAHRKEAAARFIAAQAAAISQMDVARSRYAGAKASLEAADRLLEEQVTREQLAERAFEVGEGDRVTVALARVESAAARHAHVDAVRKAQAALGDLEDALQSPLGYAPPPPPPEAPPRSTEEGKS